MISITSTSKISLEVELNFYLQILIPLLMKSLQRMFIKTFRLTKINLRTVITPKNNKYYDPTNKKVIVKFKDEAAGIPVTEFVGLR